MTTPLYASEQYVKFFFTDDVVADRPIGWEVALHSSDPSVTGDTNEVSGDSYARQDVVFTVSQHSSGSHFVATNTAAITFPTGVATDDFTITHYTIRDKATDKALASAKFPTPISFSEGVEIIIPMETIKIRGI